MMKTIHRDCVFLSGVVGSIHPLVQPCSVGPITPQSNLNLPPGQGGKTGESEQNIPSRSSTIFFPACVKHLTPSSTLIYCGCHSHLFKIYLFTLTNGRNPSRFHFQRACYPLLWVYDRRHSNDAVSILSPSRAFLLVFRRTRWAQGSCALVRTKFSSANFSRKRDTLD